MHARTQLFQISVRPSVSWGGRLSCETSYVHSSERSSRSSHRGKAEPPAVETTMRHTPSEVRCFLQSLVFPVTFIVWVCSGVTVCVASPSSVLPSAGPLAGRWHVLTDVPGPVPAVLDVRLSSFVSQPRGGARWSVRCVARGCTQWNNASIAPILDTNTAHTRSVHVWPGTQHAGQISCNHPLLLP